MQVDQEVVLDDHAGKAPAFRVVLEEGVGGGVEPGAAAEVLELEAPAERDQILGIDQAVVAVGIVVDAARLVAEDVGIGEVRVLLAVLGVGVEGLLVDQLDVARLLVARDQEAGRRHRPAVARLFDLRLFLGRGPEGVVRREHEGVEGLGGPVRGAAAGVVLEQALVRQGEAEREVVPLIDRAVAHEPLQAGVADPSGLSGRDRRAVQQFGEDEGHQGGETVGHRTAETREAAVRAEQVLIVGDEGPQAFLDPGDAGRVGFAVHEAPDRQVVVEGPGGIEVELVVAAVLVPTLAQVVAFHIGQVGPELLGVVVQYPSPFRKVFTMTLKSCQLLGWYFLPRHCRR